MSTKKKSHTIYDDDSVVVEYTEPSEEVIVTRSEESKRVSRTEKELDVDDVFDSFVGYLIPKLTLNNADGGSGECLLCGAKTQYSMRKICYECMVENKEKLYDKMKVALEDVFATVTI